MDGYEATRIVLSRIQNLEPENASKITGLLLIQDHGEKEMIRLAFGPETLLHSVILKAKEELGLVPIVSRQNSSTSSRLIGTNGVNLPFLSIPTNPSTFSWNSDELMSPSLHFHGNVVSTSMLDEVQLNQDHDLFYPQTADDPGSEFWWSPCLFYARGYCKNGNNCRFIHGEVPGAEPDNITGSLNKVELMEQCHELLRSRSARQQRLTAASQLMGSPTFPYSPKCMNLVNDSQRAATLIIGDEYDMNKFNRSRLERNVFSIKGETGMVNPASRQIYLTFPADSTFREDDVSNYFSTYGPVQDVRIPYQQKRMFGFVTFLYSETVKIILARGNPHFVCDARVLVKPYKEKWKIPDKYRQPQMERGEFSPCGTPTGLDSRDPFDLQLGARMFYNNQDLLWRRKIGEQNDLQQALELQNRRLMSLQLLDVKKHQHQRDLSSGSPIPSPSHSPSLYGQSLALPQFHSSQETPQENCSSPMPEKQTAGTATVASTEENGCDKESPHCEDSAMPESLEHNLPDSPFASPAKATGEHLVFSNAVADKDDSDNNWIASTLLPANNALDMSSNNSFNCQLPRLSSGHGTIGMYAGSGGPTCPVGI